MMKKTFTIRRVILLLLIIVVVAAAGIGIYNGNKILKSENLKTLIAERMSENTDAQVSIGGAELYLLKGARIILTDFKLEGPGESISLKARRVNVGFSLLYLIRGKLHLWYVDILEPDAVIRFDNFLQRKPGGKKSSFPRIKIVKGSFKAIFKGREVYFHHINGRLNSETLKLNVGIPSGEARIYATKKSGIWEGNFSVFGFDLKTLYPKIGGEIGVNIGFKMVDNMVYMTTRVDCPGISLPLGGQDLENVAIDIRAHGTKDRVFMDKINIHTGTVNFSGNASITGKSDKFADAILDLNLASDSFSYNKLVSHLPVDRFTFWVHKTFFEMIRGGTGKVTELKYTGSLNDFKDREKIINNLSLKGDVTGMTYGSGYGPERVTDVNGTVVIRDGTVVLNKISGMAGKSRLVIDEFYIPNIACPGLDMFLRMDVDMPFEDFVYGWKAALTPESVNDIFGKINDVRDGRISGSVTFQKNSMDAANEMILDFDICDAVFFWNENFLEDVDAHVMTREFGSPLEINLKGRLDNLPIESAEVIMADPFHERAYKYTIKALGLPAIPGFRLENEPVVLLTGTGKDRIFEGTAQLSSRGFSLFENSYEPVKGVFMGQASFTGQLRPELSFVVPDGELNYPPGNTLDFEMVKEGKKGAMKLKGNVNLYHSDETREIKNLMVKGGLQVVLDWNETMETTGVIRLIGMQYPYNTNSLVLNGTIEMKGEHFSTQNLGVVLDGSNVKISGFLNNKNSHFVGDLDVKGFKLERSGFQEEGGFRPPEHFTADVYLKMTDSELMGVGYDRGDILLSINKEGLTFNSLDLNGKTSKISGSANVGPDKGTRFDLNVDFRDDSLQTWLHMISPDKMLLKGDMHLYGNINGTPDNLNGKLKFEARDGHIQSFSLVSSLFSALNLYKIFNVKDINFGRMRFSYNVVSATFNIKDNFVKFDDFYLHSNTMRASSMGNFDIKTKQIDAMLGVQPLETIDRALSAIPVVGWVLTGEDNKLIFISLEIKGDIKDPDIHIARKGTISEPMANSLLKILKLPETFIESSKQLITSPEEKN